MTPEAVTAIANGLKLLAAGLAVVSNFGPGLAIGLLAYGAMIGIAQRFHAVILPDLHDFDNGKVQTGFMPE